SPTTWSLKTLRTMWTWARNCFSFHDKCPKPLLASRLPLRLIDVMSVDFDNFKSADEMSMTDFDMLSLDERPGVRIISTNSLPLDTPYLTLSHRWGNPPSILLTRNTKYLLYGDITPYLLSCGEAAVFRHAIHVTKALAFRYIWIDALCIMQDDDSEKTIEIMQMDQIYLNSTLNISAAEAQGREGLVFDRDILSTNPCGATVKAPEATEDAHLQAFPNKWYLRPSEAPLNKRGWVFQERMLAPRITHFTKSQVFWECHSLEASEILPQGLLSEPLRLDKGVETSSQSTKGQVRLRWYELVEAYSRTELSFADDRLLAVSALAKRCCLGMGLDSSDYLAGMWKIDLPLSMLWCQRSHLDVVTSQSTVNIERTMRHAPSWSWASILTEVDFIGLSDLVATTEVLDIGIKRLSPNFFGGTDSCRLRLRRRICRFRRERGKSIILVWDTSRHTVSNFLSTDGSISAVSIYAFLHIASEHSVDGILERGIIIQRTGVDGTYIRVGSFFTPFKSEYPGSELEKAFEGRLKTLSPEDYLELDLNGRYTIDVV
ncbi:heterokaryon incompatibility protein-domain-containing protein, partial [Phaeosphaeriaceae sp. PMI808]